jgi:mevalonate pyrophosphate decarboxylase
MEESKPKMSFAAAIRAALTKKTATEQTDTVSSKKAARKISGSGPAAITARPQRRNTGRGG